MNKIYSVILASLLLLGCVILFTTCQKEFSYESTTPTGSSTGTAVYSLKDSAGRCIGNTVIGNYYAGSNLSPANTVQLKVNVTTIGTYNLSTNSSNGILFSAAGIFTGTGVQTINLSGSGTPASVGSFESSTPVTAGCLFTVVVNTAPIVAGGFTFAGAPNACSSPAINGIYVAGKILSAYNFVIVSANVTAIGAYALSTDTLDGISFSSSGTFTATGNQNIKLYGKGTPNVPRNLIFTPLTPSSSCTFNLAIANSEPLATYVLESGGSNPSVCVYTVSGTFTSGTPLNNLNTVSVRVYATIAGNFTVETNTVNGITFSYTGVFSTLGSQNILLTGSGTPVSFGTFTLIPQIVGPHPIGGEACAISITVV